MAKLTGTNPDQVPTNADLGTMAYQDATDVKLESLNVTDGTRMVVETDADPYTTFSVGERSFGDGYATLRLNSSASGVTKIEANHINQLVFFTDNSPRMTVGNTGEVQVASGLLELDGNDIGGTQVTIADDAVASITPPRTGGFMFITCEGQGSYPNVEHCGMLFYDVGGSLRIDKGNAFSSPISSLISLTTSDVTGTTGTDGHITIAVQSGVIKIENRFGQSRTYQITFL